MEPTEAPIREASDLFRSISRRGHEDPIPVCMGAPPTFPLEAQRSVMRWSHERGYFLLDPNWLNDLDTKGIEETV